MIDALSHYQNRGSALDLEYVAGSWAPVPVTINPPSPETLAGYFDDHKTQFRAPEYRKISLWSTDPGGDRANGRKSLTMTPSVEAVSRPAATSSERRKSAKWRQMVFLNVEEATAARNRIASGLSFDDLAKERGLSPTDVNLGQISKSEIIDKAIADAAFSLPTGEVSQPAQGSFGVALVKIGKIEPGVAPSYESRWRQA